MLQRAFCLFLIPSLLGAIAGCHAPRHSGSDRACDLSFSDDGSVRVFVVGHAFRPEDALSYDAFERSYRAHLDRIRPCLSQARPNLVLFPEDAGLLAWFIGRRALLARGAGDSTAAFNAIYAGHYRQADAYLSRFPGISAARALTLALGDVAWRAMDRTFGGIARDEKVWVMTSANLPVARHTLDPAEVARFGDPDAPAEEGAWVADAPEVFNMALLYGPDGTLVDRVHKVFLTDPEEQALDLSNGSFADLNTIDLPFARIGVAISRDAFYAPFMQRLEDLGADFVVQPEAFSGWTIEQPGGAWIPEIITASGWSHTQKYRGFRHSAAPMLSGNLYEMVFDGQTWITQKSRPEQREMSLLATAPTRGWLEIGPWVMGDPGDTDPGLDLAARRKILTEWGAALAPGSGSPHENAYVSSLIAADLRFYRRDERPPEIAVTSRGGIATHPIEPVATGHQTNPDAAFGPGGGLFAIWSDERSGVPRVRVARSVDLGQTWSPSVAVTPPGSERQLRPAIAVSSRGVFVAWQEEAEGAPARVRAAVGDPETMTFSPAKDVDPVNAAQWEPDVAVSADGRRVVIVWSDFREGRAPRVRMSESNDDGNTWSASLRVDPRAPTTERLEGTQVQPSVAFDREGPVVAWLDYRERDWQVWSAAWEGNGFRPAERVTPDDEQEILASDPQLARTLDGSVLIAWDDLRKRRGHHDVRAAIWRHGEGWKQFPTLAGGADDGRAISRFRPTIAEVGSGYRLLFQDLTPGKNALAGIDFDPQTLEPRGAVGRFDDTGDAPNQLTRPRLASNGLSGVAVYEDDREGWSRIYVTAATPIP